jgi:ribosomal protein S4E
MGYIFYTVIIIIIIIIIYCYYKWWMDKKERLYKYEKIMNDIIKSNYDIKIYKTNNKCYIVDNNIYLRINDNKNVLYSDEILTYAIIIMVSKLLAKNNINIYYTYLNEFTENAFKLKYYNPWASREIKYNHF